MYYSISSKAPHLPSRNATFLPKCHYNGTLKKKVAFLDVRRVVYPHGLGNNTKKYAEQPCVLCIIRIFLYFVLIMYFVLINPGQASPDYLPGSRSP